MLWSSVGLLFVFCPSAPTSAVATVAAVKTAQRRTTRYRMLLFLLTDFSSCSETARDVMAGSASA
jgi:hypothetical protein